MKRKIIIGLVSAALLVGLVFALQFTGAAYFLVGMFGTEYYRTSAYWPEEVVREGDLPPSFHLQFGGRSPKQGTIVPCLLFYSLDEHINMLVDFSVPRDWYGAQYLDLTKLELVLQDGRREDFVTPAHPARFYFGNHANARRFYEYSGAQLKNIIKESAEQGQAHFYSSLWPTTQKARLTAEGTYHLDAMREDQKFRQVSTWTIMRGRGFRRVWLP